MIDLEKMARELASSILRNCVEHGLGCRLEKDFAGAAQIAVESLRTVGRDARREGFYLACREAVITDVPGEYDYGDEPGKCINWRRAESELLKLEQGK